MGHLAHSHTYTKFIINNCNQNVLPWPYQSPYAFSPASDWPGIIERYISSGYLGLVYSGFCKTLLIEASPVRLYALMADAGSAAGSVALWDPAPLCCLQDIRDKLSYLVFKLIDLTTAMEYG